MVDHSYFVSRYSEVEKGGHFSHKAFNFHFVSLVSIRLATNYVHKENLVKRTNINILLLQGIFFPSIKTLKEKKTHDFIIIFCILGDRCSLYKVLGRKSAAPALSQRELCFFSSLDVRAKFSTVGFSCGFWYLVKCFLCLDAARE